MSDDYVVNGLPLPLLLISLMQEGKWIHSGHERLAQLIPTLREKIEFIGLDQMRSLSASQLEIAEDSFWGSRWRYARGSKSVAPLELPWLDLEKAVDIADALERGADTGIILDYRTSMSDPRVLANEWTYDGNIWYEIDPTFTQFAERLGLK